MQSFFGMNIEDSSTVGYWTNSTERKEDWNTSRKYTDTGRLVSGNVRDGEPGGWFSAIVFNDASGNYSYYDHATGERNDSTSDSSRHIAWMEDHNTANILGNSTSVSFTSTNPPGTRAWPLWVFWVVACTLVLGSIVIPVIGGRFFRFCSRFYIKYRRSTRAALSLIYLA